jgi:hypothetical protein
MFKGVESVESLHKTNKIKIALAMRSSFRDLETYRYTNCDFPIQDLQNLGEFCYLQLQTMLGFRAVGGTTFLCYEILQLIN